MFERNRIDTQSQTQQVAIPAELTLDSGETLRGKVWVPAGRSLMDALNGPGGFLEFEPYGDARFILAKSAVRAVMPVNVPAPQRLAPRGRDADGFDPYGVLGVAVGASLEDIRHAYHRMARAYHPDRYGALTPPPEIAEYLTSMAQRINAAFATLEAEHQKRVPAGRRAAPVYESRPAS
jgi:hypothetical protein